MRADEASANMVLVTGATGFLGTRIVEELLEQTDCLVIALVRGRDGRTPLERLTSLWWGRDQLINALGTRVRVLEGDVERPLLGLGEDDFAKLSAEVSHIVHAAAEVGINQTEERFRSANVEGTRNVLKFARAAHAASAGRFGRIVHVSTAYVAGTFEGIVAEEPLEPASFNSLYEATKHEAERLVMAEDDLSYAIVRPGQIVGDSKTGFISTFNTLYYPLKLYLKGNLRFMPISAGMKVNMVPVDYVARLSVAALDAPQAHRAVLHAVVEQDQQPTVGELLAAVRTWARENLHVDLPKPVFMPLPLAAWAGRKRNLGNVHKPKRKGFAQNMLALAPYFTENRTFETAKARSVLSQEPPAWSDYLSILLEYAVRAGFLNHTGRTVFEQMLVRMESRTASLDFFDVTPRGTVRRTSQEIAADIRRAASSLKSLGVGAGDRVALIGVNSTRYLIADAAIGLLGAVSVPLYYTTPVDEAEALIRRSGACVVFAGTKQASALAFSLEDVPFVSLRSAQTDSGPADGLMPWEDFLALADDEPQARLPYVAPDALATIRYTSGTTGEPKGVTFTQHQLQWMGSVMPSLLDWKTRNSKVRYLSFLPMSHVVEGVLVAYAPYCILSDIEFYYLEDFPSLAATLPKIRPTLFFSVPRFYEKAWDQFASNGAAAAYLRLSDGVLKRLLSPLMRKVLLHKAGLGDCRQLIVGSAPMSVQLMEAYRHLGIEVHNAYGVTEAPLVAINRLNENDMGSVGRLLPETEIAFTAEGEVLVRGPQVTAAYDGKSDGALDAEGWFATGDLGSLNARGNLVLHGRGKDILVTSYGKNISPQKIEVLLKDVPGVGEAVLVGEGRPFCTAMLWPKEDAPLDFDYSLLDSGIRCMNESLSHPEQVKRWVVLERQPTISSGELTPNLKVRRSRVIEGRFDTVAALYGSWPPEIAGALHCGQA